MNLKTFFLTFFVIIAAASVSHAQWSIYDDGAPVFTIKARVVDFEDVPIPGFKVEITGEKYHRELATDSTGYVSTPLPVGKYEIVSKSDEVGKFHAFIEIAKEGVNPENFDLRVELPENWCAPCHLDSDTEVIESVAPVASPTAVAVGAVGKVAVALTIDAAGKVTSAKAISGHPLLRKVSETAASKWVFSASHKPERQATIVFNYLRYGNKDIKFRIRHPAFMDIYRKAPTLEY